MKSEECKLVMKGKNTEGLDGVKESQFMRKSIINSF